MAKIIFKKSGEVEGEIDLSLDKTSVGRDAKNALVLSDQSVSRRHAVIQRAGDGYRIIDLESGNGILYQNKRVVSQDLYHGCEVELGAYTLLFDDPGKKTAKLALIGGGPYKVYDLPGSDIVVGRGPKAQISLDEPLVSGAHFKLLKQGAIWALLDLKSENGTRVNGVRVSEKALVHGDQIRIAGLTFYFSEDGSVPEPGSVEIIQPAQAPAQASKQKPATKAEPAAPVKLSKRPDHTPEPVAATAQASTGSQPSKKTLWMIIAGLFGFLMMIVMFLLLRSPEDATEREFQDVFQTELTQDERRRVQAYLTEAEEQEQLGNLQLALENYRKVLVLEQQHQTSLAAAARLEERIEAERRAREDLERQERELRGQVADLIVESDALLEANEFDEAREILEKARSLSPESEVVTARLAGAYVAEGDYQRTRSTARARAAYEKALEINPEDTAAKNGLNRIRAGNQRTQQRRAQVEQLTEQGLAHLKREEYRQAYASFSQVLSIDSSNQRAQELRAEASQLLEQQVAPMYEEGVRLFEAAELSASMAQFHRVLELHPDHAETKAFLSRAMEQVRSEAVDKYKRAYIYQGLGRLREARDLYQEALDLLPDPNEEYHQKARERIDELNRKLP